MKKLLRYINQLFVLFGFRPNLALHLAPSPLNHSDGYGSAGDSTTCLASLPLNSKSIINYPGMEIAQ